MTAKLHLLCHAATAAARAAAFARPDEPVETRGTAETAALASRLPRFDRVLVAPSLAARQTAAALGLEGTMEQALADLDVGRWRGRDLADVAGTDPDAMEAWVTEPASNPHGGETVVDLVRRAGAWLQAVEPRGRILAITHSAVVRAVLVAMLDAPAQAFWSVDAGPLATLVLSHDGRRWRVRCPGA